jgi:hypothetical protein
MYQLCSLFLKIGLRTLLFLTFVAWCFSGTWRGSFSAPVPQNRIHASFAKQGWYLGVSQGKTKWDVSMRSRQQDLWDSQYHRMSSRTFEWFQAMMEAARVRREAEKKTDLRFCGMNLTVGKNYVHCRVPHGWVIAILVMANILIALRRSEAKGKL